MTPTSLATKKTITTHRQGYGSSEVFIISSNMPSPSEIEQLDKKSAIARHIVGSVGKLFPNNRLKVITSVERGKCPKKN